MNRLLGLRSAALALVLATPITASATPVTYLFTGGTATITTFLGATIVSGPQTEPLDGIMVTINESAGTVDTILLSAGFSPSPPFTINLAPAYGGVDEVIVSDALLSAINGTLTTLVPGVFFNYSVGPVTVDSVIEGKLAGGTVFGPAPFPTIVNPSASGSITINGVSSELTMTGITIGTFLGDGETVPLEIKADFLFQGEPASPPGGIPEPGAALLFGAGCATLAGGLRRRGH